VAPMHDDRLVSDLFAEICRIPLIDPHSHIDSRRPAAQGLDDLLGYHYYTELAHSAGMDKGFLSADVAPRERVRAILAHADRFDNTAQYGWLVEIARTFLGFEGYRVTADDADALFDAAEQTFAQPDWEEHVFARSHLEAVFLTSDFADPLEGFDPRRYVPCLRTDDLVFHLDKPEVRQRLAKATGIEVGDASSLRQAIRKLFEHFTQQGARACAISLPPDFSPVPILEQDFSNVLSIVASSKEEWPQGKVLGRAYVKTITTLGVFHELVNHCREFGLPFDLMIGVNRRVYEGGVYQGQDLFDQRTSLLQYAGLFNAFPEVTFCVSVLSSAQNQELASYSWIFPNVVTSGHWWYSNIPAYIAQDCRARLQAVPKTKQIGYYSDAYKLEFVLPKYNMYRRILARVLADDFVRPGVYGEEEALDFARLLLRDNVRRIFKV
jgi:glucuronate isomerase